MYHGMFGCCHKTKLKDSLLLSEEDGEEGRVRHSESLI